MGPGGKAAPKDLRPSLDVKLAATWRYAEAKGVFRSASGTEFAPSSDLPKGTRVLYMAPALAKADPATLTADERNLARYVQLVFPKGTNLEPYLRIVRKWPCVETVQRPPAVSLP